MDAGIYDSASTTHTSPRSRKQRKSSGSDASEADVTVLERLRAVAEPLTKAERILAIAIDARQPLSAAALAERWLALAAHGSANTGAPQA